MHFDEIWYVASETLAHHNLYKSWHWDDLELFYGKVKYGHIWFSVGRSGNIGIAEISVNHWSSGLFDWYKS